VLRIDKPSREACEEILKDTLTAFSEKWTEVKKLISDSKFQKVIDEAEGLDGRQIRKAVIGALTLSIDTVLNPALLTNQMLLKSLKQAKTVKI